jgi:phosphodiesterase/alkaline phosphatase D-like protein
VTILTMELNRREFVAAGAAAGAALALERAATARAAAEPEVVATIDFSALGDRSGWGRGWRCAGVANLLCAGGEGILEAGSDVFPNDPRPVVFAVDRRARDIEIVATMTRTGSAPGVVVRRTSARAYYAAIYDTRRGALRLMRRSGADLVELASVPVPTAESPIQLILSATSAHPTELRCELTDARGVAFTATARDSAAGLQRKGDAGVLATAETLFPSDTNPVLPALGNLHLLPWAVQEGQAVMATQLGRTVVDEIRRRSTVAFREITVRAVGGPRPSRASVLAATTGPPVRRGAELHVACDLPARVTIEISHSRKFRNVRELDAGRTDAFRAVTKIVRGLDPGRRVYWRARLKRRGRVTVGPVRSFRVPPGRRGEMRIAVAACGAQFGPIFEHLTERRPDVFVWQGDLNYPDTHGPLAQSTSGYAGIWRDFLANPLLEPLLRDAAFAPQRDDHDFGVQDANSTTIGDFPWGIAPWDSLMSGRAYYRFPAGAADFWVLDQRSDKSDPEIEDGPEKTLLGLRQRRWLLDSLARSRARFKVICSPCTMFLGGNSRDGNWSNDFEAERELLLDHVDRRVTGTTVFLTGDTHLTGVYDSDGRFEARAAPVGIPTPNDITLTDPFAADELRRQPGVAYAGDECHFTLIDVRRDALDLSLVREDGAVVYEKSFTPSRSGRTRAR